VREEFLHFVWQQKLFPAGALTTTAGEKVEVLHPGLPNDHDGPDFLEAQVKIGGVLWVGHVEIHLRSSDWYAHGHYHDPRYDQVVLHVVAQQDDEVRRSNGETVPEVVLRWDPALLRNYEVLLRQRAWVPCSRDLHRVDPFVVKHWLGRVVVERLEQHAAAIRDDLEETSGDWEEVLYRHLARGFGLQANARPFYLTARSLPLKWLARHRDQLPQVEALLFGQAGLLDTEIFGDDYYERLKKEYHYLRQKFSLTPIEGHLWRQMRMRPSAFPAIRLAEFARFIHQQENVFSRIIRTPDLKQLEPLFRITLGGYWEDHYLFNKPSRKQKKSFGKQAFHLLLINIVVPFYFIYGVVNDRQEYRERALEILEALPPEKNAVIRRWETTGIRAESAFYSQALIRLKKDYCNKGRCLACGIGMKIITEKKS
jgi:hypothetical protein